jgi:hypothetical protein
MLSFTIGASSISVFLDGVFNSIDTSHANHPYLLEELQKPAGERDLDAIRSYISIAKLLETLSFGRVGVNEEEVTFSGERVDNYMTQRMLDILSKGVGIEPWALFMDKLFDNPATYCRDELYEWMEKGRLPLTPDGNFLAFKKVRSDYKDCHTGMFDNSPGNVLEMDRAACDANRHNHCSSGFHFASAGYLRHFGGQRVVVVEINPRDVTSIPSDYQFTKGRCCRYKVVAELKMESAIFHGAWANTPVIDFENPAEFPMDMLTRVQLPSAEPNQPAAQVPVVAEPDPEEEPIDENLHDEIEDMIHEEEEAAAYAALDAMPEIDVADDTTVSIGSVGSVEIVREETPTGTVMTVVGGVGPAESVGEEPVFTTSDDRTFSASVILAALEDASIRGAAKNLGIGESTLRGWKKKLGA